MKRVLALDPALRTFGAVVVESNGREHRLVACECFLSEADDSMTTADSRRLAVRQLYSWLRHSLIKWSPVYVAAEEMGFAPSANAKISMAMGWAALVCALEEEDREVPLFTAPAWHWREQLTGDKSDEDRAHRAATRAVPGARPIIDRFPRKKQPHIYDALGMFAWSLLKTRARGMLIG